MRLPIAARIVLAIPLLWIGSAHVAPAADPLAAFDALLAREPGHVGAAHHAARMAAQAGDGERALGYLHRLLEMGFDDALEPDDFAAIADRADYRAIAARLDRASRVGDPRLHAETDCLDVLPEGAAWDASRDRFLMSSRRRRPGRGRPAACRASPSTPRPEC